MSEVSGDNKRRGLGRGLGSLLGSQTTNSGLNNTNSQILNNQNQILSSQKGTIMTTQQGYSAQLETSVQKTEGKVWQLSIEKIKSGIYQPRRNFSKDKIEELAKSIKENGILQPIIVRTKDGSFEIVAGERRWRAAQMAGLHEVPVIIKNYSDKETLELAIIENIQREDLNPLEEAEGYYRLMNEFSMSHQVIADRVGKDRTSVTNAIRLLSLPTEIREMLENSDISVGHAKVLLSIDDKKIQIDLANTVKKEKLSVRNLEKLLSKKGNKEKISNGLVESSMAQQLIHGLSDELQKILGTKVTIDYINSKGKISIYYYSDEELTQIIDRLKEGCAT